MSLAANVHSTRGSFALDASIEAADGETIGLVGPNGAGKSTLLAVLAGLILGGESTIRLDGRELQRPAGSVPARDRPVGVVFQDLRLFPHMSAADNVAFALRAAGVRPGEARRRAGELLDRLGVAHRAEARPSNLSGGEAQRVALARALIRRPRLLLLDEPLAALDITSRTEIRALLGDVLGAHDGVAIVVSHDPVDVMTLADRLVIMEQGRVTQAGTPDEIRARPTSPFASELVGVNLFRGPLERFETGLARLRAGRRDLFVAVREPFEPVADAIATLRPGDISIHTARPAGSARNVTQARILTVTKGTDRARLILDGEPPLVAEVTLGSVQALDLAEGREVFAAFKATEVTVVPA